jgi:hypothetical protein
MSHQENTTSEDDLERLAPLMMDLARAYRRLHDADHRLNQAYADVKAADASRDQASDEVLYHTFLINYCLDHQCDITTAQLMVSLLSESEKANYHKLTREYSVPMVRSRSPVSEKNFWSFPGLWARLFSRSA